MRANLPPMAAVTRPLLLTVSVLALVALGQNGAAAPADPRAAQAANDIVLVPHRAVYDLKLGRSTGSRSVENVRGRILYDFSGSPCEGYALNFRQVSEMDSGEGKTALSDLRANTWEDAQARKFRFNSENQLDQKRTEKVDGQAERKSAAVSINLNKPKEKTVTLPGGAVFPTEHLRRIIAAARSGENVLQFPVFDGSETGEKLYNTLTVIGRAIGPGEKTPQDAGAKIPELQNATRWPVTVSYFDPLTEAQQRQGEQMPVYSISFELYENGVSRALSLDYSDFSIRGEMSSIEIKTAKPCR